MIKHISVDYGDTVRLTVTFYDHDDNPAAPTNPKVLVKDPTGAVTVYAPPDLVALQAHEFQLDLYVNTEGSWMIRGASEEQSTEPVVLAVQAPGVVEP